MQDDFGFCVPDRLVRCVWRGAEGRQAYLQARPDLLQQQRIGQVYQRLHRSHSAGSRYSAAYNNRGLAYYYKNEFGKAISDCSQAIRLNPKSASAYNNGSWHIRARRNSKKPSVTTQKPFASVPRSPSSTSAGAACYSDIKDFAKAISDYTEAIRLDPTFSRGAVAPCPSSGGFFEFLCRAASRTPRLCGLWQGSRSEYRDRKASRHIPLNFSTRLNNDLPASDFPFHAGLLQPLSKHRLARRLRHSAADRLALAAVVRVRHLAGRTPQIVISLPKQFFAGGVIAPSPEKRRGNEESVHCDVDNSVSWY